MVNQYLLKGNLAAGAMPVPLEERIDASNDQDALRIANEKAEKYYSFEGYSVLLHIFDNNGTEIGTASAPKSNQRMCESCIRENLHGNKDNIKPARYREVYNDLTGTDVCKDHILPEESRKNLVEEGTLERLFDYELKKEVHPVTLKEF